MSAGCPTKLLDDLPADSDAFGSHERVAGAIADLVTQEEGGKAIALTGTWGSGKSTVVRLLRSRLRRQQDHGLNVEVFIYDAWIHQGDPLRRSFLEELIRFLASPQVGWVNQKDWQNDLDRLSRRSEKTRTKSTPVLTTGGRLIALSVLLLPLGYTLFGTISSKDLTVPLLDVPYWIVGLVLSLLPFLVASIVWLWWRPTWRIWRREFWREHRAPHQDESVFTLFVQKTQTVNRSRTVRTPDPTSIEFREIFEKVLAAALEPADRRLVVVMDNLDRVPPDETVAVWSTMRAFFDVQTRPDAPGNGSWLRKFWLLVPLDRNALTGAWHERVMGDHHTPSRQEVEADEPGTERAEEDVASKQEAIVRQEGALAAFDKVFQVEFRVSPPVLSRWKTFFFEQFAKAFPRHAGGKDAEDVYRLFRRVGLPQSRPLAPRDIKLFINKVGSLHRQWNDDIPLPMQALYVLYAHRLSDPERDLLRKDFLDPAVEELLGGSDWRRYLAALHYNVPPEDAYHVLIGREIEECFRTGDAERFATLAAIPALATVCDHVLEQNWKEWATSEPGALALTALLVEGVERRDNTWAPCWSWLAKGVDLVEAWNGLDERTGTGIVAILRHDPHTSLEETVRRVLEAIQRDGKLVETDEGEPPDEAISSWVDGVLEVLGYLHESGFGDLVRREFSVPGSARVYVAVLGCLAERWGKSGLFPYFVSGIPREQVVEELEGIVSRGSFSRAHAAAVRAMLSVGGDWPWGQLVARINQRLQGGASLRPEELSASLETLFILQKAGIQNASDVLGALCRGGHLMHHLHAVQNQPEAAAFSILAHLVALPDGAFQALPGNAGGGKQFYEGLLQNPEERPEIVAKLGELCVRLRIPETAVVAYKAASGLRALAGAILGKIVAREDVQEHLPADCVIAEWDAITELLNDEQLESLVASLLERGGLADRLVARPPEIGDGRLYFLAYEKSQGDDQQRLARTVIRILQTVDRETWLRELEREGYLVRLVLALTESGANPALGREFHDALLEHARKTIGTNEPPPEFLASKWHHLPQALEEYRRETLARTLWDEIRASASSGSLATLLRLCGEYLLSTMPNYPDEVIRRVCSPIIGRGEREEIAWVAALLERQSACWERAGGATQEDFRDRVRAKLSECEDEELRSLLERIARAIGLPPEETREDTTNGGEPPGGEEK